MRALQCAFPITVSLKQQKAQMWLLCECTEDAIVLFSPRAEKTVWVLLIRPSGTGSVFAGIPSHPCLPLEAQVTRSWSRARASPGHGGASGSWVLPEADLHLPLAPGRLSLGGNIWLFYPCFGVLKVWGVWLPRLPTAFLARSTLSDTDVPRLHLILPQKQHNFLAVFFILRMRDAHKEHGGIHSSSFLQLWREGTRRSSHVVIKPRLKIKWKCLTLFECATLNFMG